VKCSDQKLVGYAKHVEVNVFIETNMSVRERFYPLNNNNNNNNIYGSQRSNSSTIIAERTYTDSEVKL